MTTDSKTIASKTKQYNIITAFSVILEMISYLLFLIFLALVIYLPEYLQLQLTIAEDEIGFYILDPDDVLFWSLMFKIVFVVMSFYPLIIGILLRLMRRKILSK